MHLSTHLANVYFSLSFLNSITIFSKLTVLLSGTDSGKCGSISISHVHQSASIYRRPSSTAAAAKAVVVTEDAICTCDDACDGHNIDQCEVRPVSALSLYKCKHRQTKRAESERERETVVRHCLMSCRQRRAKNTFILQE